MSDTPRTDAEAFYLDAYEGKTSFQVVEAEFARKLETQLTAAKEECQAKDKLMREVVKELQSVLCDPEGTVVIHGSDGDRKVIQDALAMLEESKCAKEETGWTVRGKNGTKMRYEVSPAGEDKR